MRNVCRARVLQSAATCECVMKLAEGSRVWHLGKRKPSKRQPAASRYMTSYIAQSQAAGGMPTGIIK